MSSIRSVGCLLVVGFWFQSSNGETPTASNKPKPVISEVEVTGRDVYIRSGPSLDHYEISKLQLGDRVSIVGEQGDWYEILPPEGTFSLVSGEYVDTTDNQTGVINGVNVRVRAGSSLNANKYTVQVMLSKGDRVTILSSNPDGFLKIKPPPGATLWVNRQFVRRPGEKADASSTGASNHSASRLNANTPAPPDGSARSTAPEAPSSAGDPSSLPTASTNLKSPFSDPPRPEHRRELEELDTAARMELAKPVVEREWEPLIQRFQTIAESEPDELSRVYASHRVEQLRDLREVTVAVRDLKSIDESTGEQRRQFLARRAALGQIAPSITPRGLDVQGELRTSALYPRGSLPRRFRLIDPSATTTKTVGYVELPPDSTINIDAFLNRYVGVRASNTHLQTGGVNPIPVFLASEIVLLQSPSTTGVPGAPATGPAGSIPASPVGVNAPSATQGAANIAGETSVPLVTSSKQ